MHKNLRNDSYQTIKARYGQTHFIFAALIILLSFKATINVATIISALNILRENYKIYIHKLCVVDPFAQTLE